MSAASAALFRRRVPSTPRQRRSSVRARIIGSACSILLLAALALLVPAADPAAAATPPVPATVATTHVPPDELDRGTPQGTVAGFLSATSRRDYPRAARYLDLRALRPSEAESGGAALARKLRVVLDHTPI